MSPLAIAEEVESNLSDTDIQVIDSEITETTATSLEDVQVTPDQGMAWSFKRAREELKLLLTINKAERAELRLNLAEERLKEINQMAKKKDMKALLKAQKIHAKLVQKIAESEEAIAEKDVNRAELIQERLQKHVRVLELVMEKLQAKNISNKGINNALVKSTKAIERFQNMTEQRKEKIQNELRERLQERENTEEETTQKESEIEEVGETEQERVQQETQKQGGQ